MQVLAEYGAFSSDPEVDARSVFLVGYDGSGDWIAREYYALYPRNPPIGAVLLSSPARVLHLNRLTVPFLAVHGHQDPRFSQDPEFWTRLQEGVHHHQARYGDATRSLSFPIYGKELGAEGIGSDVVEEVISWMRKVLKEPSRPQEDLTSGNLRKTG
jgi:hypothetical protein